jgi:WD40-like Beta Propeller Repeat
MTGLASLGTFIATLMFGLFAGAGGPPGAPGYFADTVRWGTRNVVQLRSAQTGVVIRRVATFGQSLTGNGFALSPDGRSLYVTVIPTGRRWRNLLLERLDLPGGARTVIARGQHPAVSADGRRLAYASAGPGKGLRVAIRDLGSGVTRSLDLSPQVGTDTDPLNATVAWFGDGSSVAVIPRAELVALAGHWRRPPSPRGCSALRRSACLIVIHPDASGALTARRLTVPVTADGSLELAPDGRHPDSLLMTVDGSHDTGVIDRVTITGSRLTVRRVASIPSGMVLAFDPSGTHILYLLGHSPPALWRATISGARLTGRRQLLGSSQLGAVSW